MRGSSLILALLATVLLPGCMLRSWVPTPHPRLNAMHIPSQPEPWSTAQQMAELETQERIKRTNSLWKPGATSFLGPTRGFKTGDIIRVVLKVQDKAKFEGSSSHEASSTHENPLLELMATLIDINPGAKELKLGDVLRKARRSSHYRGANNVNRKELVDSTLAVTVEEVLYNGNLLIRGSQEIVVNQEKRRLFISGIIRPRDVSPNNSIESDKIAEARIYYGGSGAIH